MKAALDNTPIYLFNLFYMPRIIEQKIDILRKEKSGDFKKHK